jgi:cell division protein FtsA
VGRRFIADITDARVQEIFEKVDEQLQKIERSGMLPAGVILTGGGAKLDGILESAKQHLRLPVSLGQALGVTSVVDRVHDPSMSTAIGLVLWGQQIQGAVQESRLGRFFKKVKRVNQLKYFSGKWFRALKP